ncbi:hypothetical protein [Halostagnicola kamekurae]|uniref:Lipoprotein n=1 Tax=Halostagnicola kamekurae TaxID=619731 RepID=A0A1I6QC01_9EURY|nr:hypothetical protein [Halostagnicola kamekurae]SFS49932.1 hypothetical protein SAMN04488556_1158 [Halostagnicola kamekurae]
MKRRSLLGSLGVTVVASSAGCVKSALGPFDNSSRIGWIGVSNYDTEPHQFGVRVERDDSIVHESSHAIQERKGNSLSGEAVNCTWGKTAGTHRISAKIDETDWVEQSVAEAIDGSVGCVTARVTYGDSSDTLEIVIRENCDDVPEYNGGCEFANE